MASLRLRAGFFSASSSTLTAGRGLVGVRPEGSARAFWEGVVGGARRDLDGVDGGFNDVRDERGVGMRDMVHVKESVHRREGEFGSVRQSPDRVVQSKPPCARTLDPIHIVDDQFVRP